MQRSVFLFLIPDMEWSEVQSHESTLSQMLNFSFDGGLANDWNTLTSSKVESFWRCGIDYKARLIERGRTQGLPIEKSAMCPIKKK
ncbi:hypothetical protein E2C01_046958 [Portunus trituberculatus]|uniref:Uncharacterized protein n=1 Tax=Portunus trituberculatus TaxID=210409 RepID=A0A5B7G967_PORTR|nr:hypothetical protein [Portunus trituberculatus]